jgi:hypothetical protein
MSQYVTQSWRFWLTLRELHRILCTLNRHSELERLVMWAKRKRLLLPLKTYQNRLAEEERRLFRYAVEYPRMVVCARFLHQFNRLISRPPRYPAKGSARAYRYG